MKAFIAAFILASGFNPVMSFAQTDSEHGAQSWEVRETALEQVELKPSGFSEARVLQDEELTTKRGRTYRLTGDSIESESVLRFEGMSEAQQKNFHDIRRNILKRMASILDSQALTIGAGIATKNKLVGLFKKRSDKLAVKPTIREQGAISIEGLLNGLNKKFWRESSKIGDAKEVTFFLNPTGQITLGLPKYGIGGALGATIAVGYSKETDVLFLDVLVNVEKLRSGFVFFAGVKVLSGLHFDSAEGPRGKRSTQKGATFYPLVLPMWEGAGRDYYSFGVSTAISLPPPPVTDIFTYTMDVKRTRLIRLGISSIPFWTLVYKSLIGLNASKDTLIKFAEKANMDVSIYSCSRVF